MAPPTVARITREHYLDLDIPLHSRWRHFAIGGRDRCGSVRSNSTGSTRTSSRASASIS